MLKLLICLSIPRSLSSYFYILGILILSQCDRLLFVRLLFLFRLIGSVGWVFPIRFACSLAYLHCIHDSVSSLWFGIAFISVRKDRSSGGLIVVTSAADFDAFALPFDISSADGVE